MTPIAVPEMRLQLWNPAQPDPQPYEEKRGESNPLHFLTLEMASSILTVASLPELLTLAGESGSVEIFNSCDLIGVRPALHKDYVE